MKARQYAQGQATTELLVCLLVLVPMFLGVYYMARYADVKHSAIQASRYVAFERAFDPQAQAKNTHQLANEARARFFVQYKPNEQAITYLNAPTGQKPGSQRIPLWSDVKYQPLLADYSHIHVTEKDLGQLSGGLVGKLQQNIAQPVFNLPRGGIKKAEVTVSLADVTHFEALRGVAVGLPGATAIAAGAWNSSGSKSGPASTCQHVKRAVLGQYAKPATDLIGYLIAPLFEPHAPDVGRLIPDLVPTGSLQNSKAQNVGYGQQMGNEC